MDDVELDKIGAFEEALHNYMGSTHKTLMDNIDGSGDFSDEIESSLKSAVEAFKASHTW